MFRRLAAIAFVCGLGGVLIAYTLGSPSWSASAAIPSRPDGIGQAQGGAMTRPFGLTIQQVRTCSVIAPASSAPAPPEPGVWWLQLGAAVRPSLCFAAGTCVACLQAHTTVLPGCAQPARSTHTGTVILLHGLGDTGHGWAPVGPQVGAELPRWWQSAAGPR